MESFKEYMNKSITPIEAIRNIISNYSKNIEPNKTDINVIIKSSPLYSKIAALSTIKYNKKIPKEFIDIMNTKKFSSSKYLIYSFINKIKERYNDQIPDIIKRNPELLEHFL